MLERFYPSLLLNNIYELDISKLKKNHISLLVFDIDNTLVPYFEPYPTDTVLSFLTHLIQEGFSIALVSNNSAERVNLFNENLSLFSVARAKKPLKSGLLKAIRHFHATIETTAVIGDQLFTDVYAGNRLGAFSVYVTPIALSMDTKETLFFRLKRWMEKIVMKKMNKRNQTL